MRSTANLNRVPSEQKLGDPREDPAGENRRSARRGAAEARRRQNQLDYNRLHGDVSRGGDCGAILFYLEGFFRVRAALVDFGRHGDWDGLPPPADASRV